MSSANNTYPLSAVLLFVAAMACSGAHHPPKPPGNSGLVSLLQQTALGTPEARPALNLSTGVPLVFAQTSRGFSVATLGKDSIHLSAGGFSLAFGEGSGVPASTLHVEIVRGSSSAESPRGIEPARSVTNQIVGSNSRVWQTGRPTFSAVRYPAVQKGIDLVYTANSRALRSSYRVAPGADAASIRLRLPGLRQNALDPVTGRVRLEIAESSGSTRALTLLPPQVTEGGKTLSARYLIEGNAVGLAVERRNPAAELRADFELVYGDISYDYDARTDADGSSIVVRSITSADGRNDILVARLDARGRLLFNTVVGGSGDDVPLGMTMAEDGSLYVTGKTTSQDFPLVQPLQPRHRGGYDAFLLKLDRTGQRLLVSTYLGGGGHDAGEAVVLDGTRGIFVAGQGRLDCGDAPANRSGFATLFPTSAEGDRKADYFLAHLPSRLDRLVSLERFTAPRLRRSISVWMSAVGVPVVGIFYSSPVSCNPGTDQTYSMSFLGDPAFDQDEYVNINKPGNPLSPTDTGWGYHALRWKALGNPSIPYSAAAAVNIPRTTVSCNFHDDSLNIAEGSAPVFTSDPGGVWQCYPHMTEEGLGLAAAFYMHRFASPVYTTVKFWDSLVNQWLYYGLAIEQVTFCAVGPGTIAQPLHDKCNFGNIDPTMINDNCVYASQANYLLKEIKGRSWGKSFLVYYQPSVLMQPDYGNYWWGKWYFPGDYIGDPPVHEAHLLPYIDDAARQLTNVMLTERELEIRIHPVLGPSRAATFTGLVRPLDLADNSVPAD